MACEMRASFAQPAVENRGIRINAAVAEERPIAPHFFALRRVAFNDEDFFFVIGSLGDYLTERIGHKGISPEFQARVAIFGLAFESTRFTTAAYTPLAMA